MSSASRSESNYEVILNGKASKTQEGQTLGGFLREHSYQTENVIVELNGTILQNLDFDTLALKRGDHLELIYYISGGK